MNLYLLTLYKRIEIEPLPFNPFQEDWECSVSLYMPEIYRGSLAKQPDTVTVNSQSRHATFSDLSLTAPGRYFLYFECTSPSTGLIHRYVGDAIDVLPEGYVKPQIEASKQVCAWLVGGAGKKGVGEEI